MFATRIRVYDLARELKQDTKQIIEDLRSEGAEVSVPSNTVSIEIADKVRNKYKSKNTLHFKIIKSQKYDIPPGGLKISEIRLPMSFKFTNQGVYDFDRFLDYFDWTLSDTKVRIDFSFCRYSNFQALSLLVLYIWYLKSNRCEIELKYGDKGVQSATTMWRKMGARNLFDVLNSPNINFVKTQKPLFAIRNSEDSNKALKTVETFMSDFNIEYEKTLRYIIAELLYNTIEHANNRQIPSLLEFSWYRDKRELSFIVADLGIGIRKHLSQTYPRLVSDVEAIELALKPQVSGTFGTTQPYQAKNNAGVGLYISSNIAKMLRADMYIVSGNGLMHISPTQIVPRNLSSFWRGTFVYITLKIRDENNVDYQNLIAELRQKAQTELTKGESNEQKQSFYLHIRNYFGRFAEDKSLAIRIRDRELLPAIEMGKSLTIDFEEVELATHSLLNALLATPVQKLGMTAYKKIKIINSLPEIRETIDFILDENTG